MPLRKRNVECDVDYEVIWLAPICEGNNRAWCQDYAWQNECDCGEKHRPVKYVRAKPQPRKKNG
jgi:hypothetical protein